ncbi:MAG: hypothetical protein Q4Q62_03560 [Thermoplasmata archaeon]|nr:hypothetical protein [Thermoplasmata archaeon]
MKRNERFEEAVESASDRLDRLEANDAPPRITAGEDYIVRIFPYFVISCLIVWMAGLVYIEDRSFSKMIEVLCLSFTLCFALLGIPCSQMMMRGALSGWRITILAIILTVALYCFSPFTGVAYFAEAIHDLVGFVGIELTGIADAVIGFLGTFCVILFTSIGVTTVISCYLRRYIPDVIATMNEHAEAGVRGKAERFFMIPDIVDVQEVVLEQPEKLHRFDVSSMLSITLYLFVMGLLVSSYLFVNPLFLQVMSWKTMFAITLMLSMFTPALILPWQIFRSIGAKARTEAHRDYYLWHGAKSRLFTTFFALGAFMMMFVLSVYLGNDVGTIINNYLSFLVPLLATSLMYGMLYANNFEIGDRESIYYRYVTKYRAPDRRRKDDGSDAE